VSQSPRIEYGAQRLTNALQQAGYTATFKEKATNKDPQQRIVVGTVKDEGIKSLSKRFNIDLAAIGKEGFTIKRDDKMILVAGGDASGALYGCMELTDQVTLTKTLPATIDLTDKPQMVLRGTCIGVQKPYYLPGRTVYEYPYTPETFP